MKVIGVLLLTLGVVLADVGLGYHYKVPQTSYGVPSYQLGTSSQQSSAFSGYQAPHNTGYQAPHNTGYQATHNTGYQATHNTGYQAPQNTGYQTSASGSGFLQSAVNNHVKVPTSQTQFQTQYQSSSQYQSSAVNKYANYYQVQQQPAQVFKHFYIHAAPEEQEEVRPRAPIVLPPPQKHYKIIFVKAPSESSPPNLIAPIQPQNEEKTIVYVLVKKPDDVPDVVLPKIEQKPPSKPEVYFIKYKNKDDSQAVINNIVQDYNKGGQSVSVNSGLGESSSSFSSGLGSVQYQAPVQQGPSSGAFSQTFGQSSTSVNSGGQLGSSHLINIAPQATASSTVSSANFEGGAISTSQGVPHETYGPPKFRAN